MDDNLFYLLQLNEVILYSKKVAHPNLPEHKF